MADDSDLSTLQTEKLLQFQDLTGIEDMVRCRDILENHNWDIEIAVHDTLNEQEGTPSVFNPPSQRTPIVNTNPSDLRIYTVSTQRPRGLFGWTHFFLTFPFRFLYSTIFEIFRFAYRQIRPDPRRNIVDPVGDVTNFIHKFEEKYGDVHPVFYQGTYSQALNDAKRELRFLLIYLHGEEHQDTPFFCSNTLCHPEIVEFVNTRMLFWACSVSSAEGYRVSQALRENSYPFLAMIVLRESRMTVVARIEGPVYPEELINRLTRIMDDNEASLIVARADRQERSMTQTIRQQQDQAYLESLLADQEKERRRREERERLETEARRELEREMEEGRRRDEIQQQKIEMASMIPDEPLADDPDSIKIVIKLPQGTRLERRFDRHQSLKYLYYFVFCHSESPNDFQIISNYPRRILMCQPLPDNPEPPSFAEAGLGRSEVLFVQDNEA